ncbi:uncharacterized protein APUU_70390S [Aspergillus puulaauensis]|uniref:Uncharacterized protein n=1 Tax=Aspergillus puulaauensis TaxID=1220207 RepID=A0A7R7XW64_9EURO|nr:uncharacterized protein APUU_70390S [Aspergillus puulaauensis]BCS28820.1 hypothetical protein APUU_70390S [Aspergillus puulaauensis]
MPQSLSQPAPQIQEPQSFVIGFLPWFCLSISSIFILILLRKHIAGLCRNLWSYLPCSLRISVENFSFGQNCRRKGVYMKIDESGEIGNDDCFVNTGNDEDISHNWQARINYHGYETPSETETDDLELDSNNTLNLTLTKYFNPTTSLVFQHILEPPSPVTSFFPRPLKLTSRKSYQREESTNARNARPLTPIDHKNANTEGAMDAPTGWVHNIIETAVRRLERLHTAEYSHSRTSP